MDNVRERVKEQNHSRNRKILLGIIAIVVIAFIAVLLESTINKRIEDIVIQKSDVTEEKAIFISAKKLDTQIIAVQATDGTYRLAFNDCMGCYYETGKHGKYKNNSDNTGLICDTCNTEVMYDDMGFLTEETMPYPIAEMEIISDEEKFVIPEDYLQVKKQILEDMRAGKSMR